MSGEAFIDGSSRVAVMVTLLPSIHDVMALERALKDSGVECDLIPVPRQLSSECGMAVEIRTSSVERVAVLARDARILVEGFFFEEEGEYTSFSPREPKEER